MMKCVMVIDEHLPVGLIANTSAVLAMTIGDRVKDAIGNDIVDRDGQLHRGITKLPIPLLKGTPELIRSIRQKVMQNGDNVFWVDFCDVAQRCVDYDDYTAKLQQCPEEELNYLGIALYGPAKKINKLTGSIGLLR